MPEPAPFQLQLRLASSPPITTPLLLRPALSSPITTQLQASSWSFPHPPSSIPLGLTAYRCYGIDSLNGHLSCAFHPKGQSISVYLHSPVFPNSESEAKAESTPTVNK
ncbi:hypothetical protein E2C01_075130 [Portunus trituberculatus]|uniref:Uncharacterized protein n=1 Tax=Portunus trituberculatus TaxID=210409 RepID=A0A5B7I7P8_PORTR|nr:hypothetical protein [Portunus trituberculatus]